MTGRDLIVYILENNLEDKPVFENGNLLGFKTSVEAAIEFGVGIMTIEVWVKLGQLEGVRIGDELYIPANAVSPLSKGDTNDKKDSGNDPVHVFISDHSDGRDSAGEHE